MEWKRSGCYWPIHFYLNGSISKAIPNSIGYMLLGQLAVCVLDDLDDEYLLGSVCVSFICGGITL